MEGNGEKRLENALSQKALQMCSSNARKIWILGFICGICFTFVFVLIFSPLWQNLPLSFYLNSPSEIFKKSSLPDAGIVEHSANGNTITIQEKDESSIVRLYNTWSMLIDKKSNREVDILAAVPRAPYLEDCEKNTQRNKLLDNRAENGSLPDWTIWKGYVARVLHENVSSEEQISEQRELGPITPWIEGSYKDNYPLTRMVQRDIWLHQHPPNCKDRNMRFLVADWERLPGLGIGAQLAGMTGLLAIAIKERRVLVTNYYNRADHSGCLGTARSHWSCYFLAETSVDCRNHAMDLMKKQDALINGVVKVKENYTSK